MLPLVS